MDGIESICEFCRRFGRDPYLTLHVGLAACYRCGPYMLALDHAEPKLSSHLRARAICNTMARHGWRQV